jgi:NAD(P)-dependent dehydrogenase (short-subunit alcohol dehydrogenase family)
MRTGPLSAQAAVVTGAAQGIGRGIALVLAEAGARIVIGDLQDAAGTVHAIEAVGGDAVSTVMDVSRPDQAEMLVELALRTYGRLDILVNNAGIDAPSQDMGVARRAHAGLSRQLLQIALQRRQQARCRPRVPLPQPGQRPIDVRIRQRANADGLQVLRRLPGAGARIRALLTAQ